MPVGGRETDMTDVMVETYRMHHLDVLVCLGGGGTQNNARRLVRKGMNIITIPKTIDNDVAMTDVTLGFDTALGIATEALDRLHSTAHSHHRIILMEIMGHNAGWLALGAGIAGGADVILIPEIPYDVSRVAEAILSRSRGGKQFSIVAVSEGAMSREDAASSQQAEGMEAKGEAVEDEGDAVPAGIAAFTGGPTLRLAGQLEELTGLESRVTILGHLQRGGTPSAADRLLATRLGTACAALIDRGIHGVMVAARGEDTEPVPLEEVAGKRRSVPLEHPWIESARSVGTSLGD
jgi:6-phosphofructokinase 1